MRLSSRLREVSDLSTSDGDAMLDLMNQHFSNVVPSEFRADLDEKRWVIQVVSEDTGELCGFSTQMVLEAVANGEVVRALFSGDTIIDRRYWGDQALTHEWGQLALSLIDEYGPLYWFLISQGYKTYRFLPVFFHEFYPRYDAATPQAMQDRLDALSRLKYADRYDAHSGVIHANANQYRLREGVAELSPERLRDPHVRFFAERNPGHNNGDELCCLTPLSRENFTAAAWRVIGAGSVK